MPDLNWDHEPLQQAIYEIGHFWLNKGVDGFRLDAAHHIFPCDRLPDNHRMWEAFRQAMQEVDAGVYLVGEVYSTPDIVTLYLTGLPALFNFGLAERIISALQSEHDSGLVAQHLAIRQAYQAANSSFVDATILSNHDQSRIASVLNNHPAKLRLAAALLYTLPGTPYLYYGEELGMLGQKPDERIREPFPWDQPGQDPLQSTWIDVQRNQPSQVAPLSQQQADSTSLYHHYRRLIHQRKTWPALQTGDLAPTAWQRPGLVSFYRRADDQHLLVVHNLSDQPLSYPSPSEAA
jgi:alpha-amylase